MFFKKKIELYSFDVFDTLITRKVAAPWGIFSIMQEKLKNISSIPDVISKNFYDIRIKSAIIVANEQYKINYTKTTKFDSIYEAMQKRYSISDEQIRILKDLEIETEIENIVAIQENIDKLKKLVEQNKKVVLISDMYFSSEIIRKFLLNFDEVFKDIKIYVSSEYAASKGSGILYEIVRSKENVNYKNWSHIGDNVDADYKSAKRLGIKAFKYNYPSLTEYEKDLIKLYPTDCSIQQLIGTAKLLRLNNKYKTTKLSDRYEFGASYAAPMLFNYVNYILNTSLKNDFKTLYFIARDGYILKNIADIIIEKHNLPIKTKYLYGSRLAWQIPNEKDYEETINSTPFYNIDYISYKLHVSTKTILKYIKVKSTKKQLDYITQNVLKNILLNNKEVKDEIIATNKKRENLLIEYLKQEINLNEKNIVFVDSNGVGGSKIRIAEYLQNLSPDINIYNLYFFRGKSKVDLPESIVNFISYFKDKNQYPYVIELICRANHGQTIDYKEQNGKIIPNIETTHYDWEFDEVLEGIRDFTNTICDFYITDKNSEQLVYSYCYYFEDKCDKKIANILGDVINNSGGSEVKPQKYAPSPTYIELLLYFLNKKTLTDTGLLARKIRLGRKGLNVHKFKTLEDYKYNSDLISKLRLYKILKELKSKKIVLWGASIFLKEFIYKYNINFDNIVAISDINSSKSNTKLGKYNIVAPSTLKELSFDYIILTVKNNNSKIYNSLIDLVNTAYPDKLLLPNIFDNSSFSLFDLFKIRKYDLTVNSYENKIRNLEKNTNILIQNNISTAMHHQKIFTPFKNKYNNKEIVIVGPNSSILNYDSNKIFIGIDNSFQKSKIKFDYIFLQNYTDETKEYINELNNYNIGSGTKFYAISYKNQDNVIPESEAIKANALRYIIDEPNRGFTYDISYHPIGNFKSAIFSALQFALWTNPKKIYLDGCDYIKNDNPQNKNIPNSDYILNTFKQLKVFVNTYYPETEIIVINPININGLFTDSFQYITTNQVN